MPQMQQRQMPQIQPNNRSGPVFGGQKNISEIKVPDSVKNILNKIKTSTSLAGTTDTQDSASNNERLVSDVNISDSRKPRKNKSIPSISINT